MAIDPASDPVLSAAEVAAWARDPSRPFPTPWGPREHERVAGAHATLERISTTGTVYGLTTGVGALRHVEVVADERTAVGHALRLWRSHAAGVGAEYDDATARAVMLIRLHQLTRGGAGVSPALVEGLATALRQGAIPRLHEVGGIGTGDLTVLAELGLTLAGHLPWRADAGVPPVDVAATDALPFLSSNAATAAVATLALADLRRFEDTLAEIAALSHRALRGSLEAYDPRVFAARRDPWASRVAARLLALLEDAGPAARVQDPFGLRTVPQVHGPLVAAHAALADALDAEIDAATENPLVVDDERLHHGQFATQRLAVCLDGLRSAWVPALTLSVARLGALLDSRLTDLPDFLADGPAGSSGLMILEYVAADLLARARPLARPVTDGRTVVSLGLEESASHATQAALAGRDLVGLVPHLLACEVVAAVRALRLAPERAPAPGTHGARLLAEVEQVVPDVRSDHVLGPEIEATAAVIATYAGD
ncbi:aromatic amino acid ammonia-lyase [Nocardioides fonticola]|uniref:aromatic amino acid ammonia-lyase n=1 Tax=Nocardioides fonticola TaxID=450363 RepID=UPI0031D09095